MTPKFAITERLSALQSWRYGLRTHISRIESVMNEHHFLDVDSHRALLELLKRVNDERVTVAFVAEPDRGDFDLINALFFSDLARPLLPARMGAKARCVTQIRFDPTRKTSVRVLPIESRESPRRLQELIEDPREWRSIQFDSNDASSTTKALAALGETRRINLADAVAWGLHVDAFRARAEDPLASGGENERRGDADLQTIDVPRWRHAIINLPHPLLDAGLVVIDIPGQAALATEPELRREWLPAADVIVAVTSLADGISKLEQSTWREHLGGPRSGRERALAEKQERNSANPVSGPTRVIAANRIEQITEPAAESPEEGRRAWMREIDSRAQALAEMLHLDPKAVVAVSSQWALSGTFQKDRDAQIRSRLYQLERAISSGISDARQTRIANEIVTSLSDVIEAAQGRLDAERFEVLGTLQELTELHGKNQRLTDRVLAERDERKNALIEAQNSARALKPVHMKLAAELAALVSTEATQRDIENAKSAIALSMMPAGITEALDKYFAATHARIDALAHKIEEIRLLFGNAGEHMFRVLDLGHFEVHPFATQRFDAELTKVRESVDAEFARVSSLKLKRGSALSAQFEPIAKERVTRIFVIAERESTSWMRGILAALEKPLQAAHASLSERSIRADKISAAQMELTNKVADLQATLDVVNRKHKALAWLRDGLARWVNGVEETEPLEIPDFSE